jgi:uncharacterized repeat protein (TIGR04042 family)
MPELHFRLRWPDGGESTHYSPSSVVLDYFSAGQEYEITDFLSRARAALTRASARVQEKYGYACTRARSSLDAIEHHAVPFTARAELRVKLLEFLA